MFKFINNKNNILVVAWIFILFVALTTYLNYIYFDRFITDISIYTYLLSISPFMISSSIFILVLILFIQYKVYKRKLALRTNCQIQFLELEQIANNWLDDEEIAKNYEVKYNEIIETSENEIKTNSIEMLQVFLARDIKNKTFFETYIFPYIQFYSDAEIAITLDLLELLEKEASKIPSVATIFKDDHDKKNFKKSISTDGLSSYEILSKVNLYAHTLNVVRFIIEAIKKEHKDNYMFFISKVIIIALAHDIGKIRNIKTITDTEDFEEILYSQVSHEKMSKLLLVSMFPDYEYLDEVIDAIECHHLKIKDEEKFKEENLLKVLLINADHKARAFEIKEFHNTDKEKKQSKISTNQNNINHTNIDRTHKTSLGDEMLGDLVEKILNHINYVKTFKASGKQKIISISHNDILYLEKNEFNKFLKQVGLDPNKKEDSEAIYNKLLNDGMIANLGKILSFSNTNGNMPVKTSTPYIPIKAQSIGLTYEELALSKRDEPFLRNVQINVK
jgi:hypothetical protein